MYSLVFIGISTFIALSAAADVQRTLIPFRSNGCSAPKGLFDINYTECCVQHDFAYGIGGGLEDKQKADTSLIKCIQKEGASNWTGGVWQALLSVFGEKNWGTNWEPRRPMTPLTAKEWRMVNQLAGSLTPQIPIVKSYKPKSVCPEHLYQALIRHTTLSHTKVNCYELVGGNSNGNREKTLLIYSSECDIGYFVYRYQDLPINGRARNGFRAQTLELGGYGLCSDKIRKTSRTEGEPTTRYLQAPSEKVKSENLQKTKK